MSERSYADSFSSHHSGPASRASTPSREAETPLPRSPLRSSSDDDDIHADAPPPLVPSNEKSKKRPSVSPIGASQGPRPPTSERPSTSRNTTQQHPRTNYASLQDVDVAALLGVATLATERDRDIGRLRTAHENAVERLQTAAQIAAQRSQAVAAVSHAAGVEKRRRLEHQEATRRRDITVEAEHEAAALFKRLRFAVGLSLVAAVDAQEREQRRVAAHITAVRQHEARAVKALLNEEQYAFAIAVRQFEQGLTSMWLRERAEARVKEMRIERTPRAPRAPLQSHSFGERVAGSGGAQSSVRRHMTQGEEEQQRALTSYELREISFRYEVEVLEQQQRRELRNAFARSAQRCAHLSSIAELAAAGPAPVVRTGAPPAVAERRARQDLVREELAGFGAVLQRELHERKRLRAQADQIESAVHVQDLRLRARQGKLQSAAAAASRGLPSALPPIFSARPASQRQQRVNSVTAIASTARIVGGVQGASGVYGVPQR